MKTGCKALNRILSAFLSLAMILSITPVTSFTAVAADDSLPALDYIEEYNAKTSTAIKNISSMMNASSNSAQYSAMLKRAGGYAALLGGSIDAIRGAIYSYDSSDAWYENIWNIGSGAIAGFLGLNSSVSAPSPIQYDLNEMKSMIQDMDQDIQEINDKLDNLDEVVKKSFEDLSGKIADEIQETEYKQFLNEFTQVNDRNAFSYYSFFKPDLNQKYNELLVALEAGNEESIKQAYDNLYLVAKQSDQLYYYISGESRILTDKQSIQDILYDYSVLSSEENFELTCVAFAEDVNSTFIFAQYCLSLCYNYQLLYAQMNGQSYDEYYYVQQNDTSIESIQYSSISSKTTDLLNRQNCVTRNMAKYMCKVLRLNGEFDYTSNNIRFGTIPYNEISTSNIYGSVAHVSSSGNTVYYRTNNNVQKGDVIQICEMPDAYMSMFNPQGYSISVSNTNVNLSNGVVRVVGSSGSFDVVYSYDGVECYRTSFNIVSKYSGGLGIEQAPYLISTGHDFREIRTAEEQCFYLLINDINFGGSQLPLMNISSGGFGGVLDGGGYKVYNYKISTASTNNYQINNSLFPIIKSGATVKNLTVGNIGYTTQHYCAFSPSGYSITAYNGILSGINEGTISNCSIQNVQVDARIVMPSNASYFWSLDAYMGGFSADNRGIIAHSVISNSSLIGRYQSNQAPCRLFVGGISGANRYKVFTCYSLENKIVGETTASSALTSTQSLIYGGNIIGENYGSYSNVYGENCSMTLNPYGSHTKAKSIGVNKESMPAFSNSSIPMGYMDRGDGKAVLDHDLAKKMSGFVEPHKTVYYVGDAINLTGLKLHYGSEIKSSYLGVDSETRAYDFVVSGFDSSKVGSQTVSLKYKDLSVSFDVMVLCPHQWENGRKTVDPSHMQYGIYTEVCSLCGESKETIIDKIEYHTYSSWSSYNTEEHQKVCECGDVVTENHIWGVGVPTIPATYTSEGLMTYTCEACRTTYTEPIPQLLISADTVAIVVDDTSGVIGSVVDVNICLANNPGITSMCISVNYDSELLKLKKITYNPAMGGSSVSPEDYELVNGQVILYWTDGFNNYTEDGVFVTLTFEVRDTAVVGEQTEIYVTYEADDIYDVNEVNVTFALKSGNVRFIEYLPGDINGDGVVNTKDTTRLMRYFAGWEVNVVEVALDVNGDGVANTKDTTRLMRYLAGWDVSIH